MTRAFPRPIFIVALFAAAFLYEAAKPQTVRVTYDLAACTPKGKYLTNKVTIVGTVHAGGMTVEGCERYAFEPIRASAVVRR